MALSLKDRKLAQSFKQRLERLGCPFIDGVDESWIIELLFRPGEPRIRLLQWLFTRFDSSLGNTLDPQYVASDRKMDSRLQRILFVASVLGLCDSDDADLIRGTVSVGKQTVFMDHLIDLVHIRDSAEDPKNKSMQSPGMVSASTDLEIQFNIDCDFMDALVSTEKMNDVFLNKAKLLPPDLTKKVEIGLLDRGYQEITKVPNPDVGKLIETAKEFAVDLQKQNEILEELTKLGDVPHRDAQVQEKVNRTLRLVLSELSQLLVGFSYCYENELRSWCNKTPPELIQLGPAVKRVYNLLQQFSQLAHSYSTIRENDKDLCDRLKEEVTHIKCKMTSTNSGSAEMSIAEYFQKCTDVLEESLNREENQDITNYSDPSVTCGSSLVRLR